MTQDSAPPDHGARIHRAAHDPGFPEKREAAVAAILSAMGEVAEAQGFTAKGRSWVRSGPLGTATLHLQRSRYGFEASVNLGFQPLKEEQAAGPWLLDDYVQLDEFTAADTAVGPLIYLDVLENPAHLADSMHLLQTRALPWLCRHLTDPDAALQPL